MDSQATRLELEFDEENVDVFIFKAYIYLSESETEQLSGEVHHYSNGDIKVIWDNQEKWLFENCYRISNYLKENELDILCEPMYKKDIQDSFKEMLSSIIKKKELEVNK